jgi:hypothetical protein
MSSSRKECVRFLLAAALESRDGFDPGGVD